MDEKKNVDRVLRKFKNHCRMGIILNIILHTEKPLVFDRLQKLCYVRFCVKLLIRLYSCLGH